MFWFLVVFCTVFVTPGHVLAKHKHHHHKGWDRLAVTFGNFSTMPTNVQAAKKDGWTLDSFGCEGNTVYAGNRYIKNGDKSTRLLFANDGIIAGIQATVTPDASFPAQGAPWVCASQTETLLTAYFRDPAKICKKPPKKCKKPKTKFGDKLYIQTKSFLSRSRMKDKILKMPLYEKDLDVGNQAWVKGQCFRFMGRHYWYRISRQVSCDNLFPVFLMYDESTKLLKAFGWAITKYISSPRWLHPTKPMFKYFFDLNTVPDCLEKQQMSTQHIYLTDWAKLVCSETV